MTAEIISVGTELLLGNILNTNAQYLSRELAALGITVQRESTIGDNHDRLADFVNEAKQRCDLLVFTGGLGPTADDLTKETVAGCYGDTLAFDPEEWQKIVDFFTRTGRKTTPNNRKQAMVPVNGHKITNNHGTAPGAWFEQDGHCAVLMPGVPHEMKAMWEESVRPLLLARQNCTAFHHAAGAGRRKRYRIPCAASAGKRKSHRRNLLQDRRVRDPHYCPGRNRQFSRKNVPRIRHKVL